MKLIKDILGRFFAFWTLLVFTASMLLFFIPIWATGLWAEPRRTVYVFKVFAVWMKFFFVLAGVRRVITGTQYFKKGKAYVVICNHNSFMDVPLTSTAIPGPNKTIAKEEMAKIPLFGMVYKRGSVLVNRKSEESRRSSYGKMKQVLKLGFHMCIYPEGTRNKTSQPLQRFHDGAFKLAADTGHNIIPSVIFNTKKMLPANKTFFFWPYPAKMHFLPEIEVYGKTPQQLKQEAFEMMSHYYTQHQ